MRVGGVSVSVFMCVCVVGVFGGNECLAHEKGPSDLNQMATSVEELAQSSLGGVARRGKDLCF